MDNQPDIKITPKPNYTRRIQIQLVLLALIGGYLVAPLFISNPRKSENILQTNASIITSTTSQPTSTSKNHFDGISLSAKSAYVWDIKNHKELYNYRANEVLPLASLTKVMMAIVAVDLLPKDTEVTISADDLVYDGDQGLAIGERWNLSDLLDLTLVSSSNDGASALAAVAGAQLTRASTTPNNDKAAFIRAMNQKAEIIGLNKTKFNNESGLDIESYQSGAYGTARDMARMFEYVHRTHPSLLSATAQPELSLDSSSKITHHVMNTNTIVEQTPGILSSKTGYTDLAGGNLVMVVDIGINHPIAIAVLGSTREARYTDMQRLIDATLLTITKN